MSTKTLNRIRALCTATVIALAACGDSPTEATYTDLTGSWEGELEGYADGYRLRLELVQESGGTITGTGKAWIGSAPVQDYVIDTGRFEGGELSVRGSVGDPANRVNVYGQVSPGLEQIDAGVSLLGTVYRLWLYRR